MEKRMEIENYFYNDLKKISKFSIIFVKFLDSTILSCLNKLNN